MSGVREAMSPHTTYVYSSVIYDYFMEASLDKPPSKMFDLFSRLYEKIASGGGKSNRNALSSVSCPDMEARVSRTTVDGETIEIGMKSCQNGIFLAIFSEIRCSRTK